MTNTGRTRCARNVTAARDQGVGLGFFVANSIYWQIRFEPSLLDGTANRTIVGYKENWQNDPDAQNPATYYLVTTRWRDPHVTLLPEPGGRIDRSDVQRA